MSEEEKVYISLPKRYKYIYAIERNGILYINLNYLKQD